MISRVGSSKARQGKELVVEAKWIQRRFMPGGNIPATVELLLTVAVDRANSPEENLVDAAKIVLSAAGYDVRSERNGGISISGNDEERLLISVRDIAPSKASVVYVQLMPNKRSQQGALGQYDAWKSKLPLLVGDLYFLANVRDPKWTASLLAHLAQPKRLWPSILKEFIEQRFRRELRRGGNYRNLLLDGLPKAAVIAATSVEIQDTERLAGRQAKIGGTLTVGFRLAGTRNRVPRERSKDAVFEVKIGPSEFSIVKFSWLP